MKLTKEEAWELFRAWNKSVRQEGNYSPDRDHFLIIALKLGITALEFELWSRGWSWS